MLPFHRFVAVAIAATASARAARAEILVQGVSPLVKIQPDSPPPYPSVGAGNNNPDLVPLSAARNEFESFQLVIYNANADMRGIDFGTSGLTGPNGATIPIANIRFYREAYVRNPPTNFEALLNDVPDPLIPKVDEGYAGGQPQIRSAFFHFSAGAPLRKRNALLRRPIAISSLRTRTGSSGWTSTCRRFNRTGRRRRPVFTVGPWTPTTTTGSAIG